MLKRGVGLSLSHSHLSRDAVPVLVRDDERQQPDEREQRHRYPHIWG